MHHVHSVIQDNFHKSKWQIQARLKHGKGNRAIALKQQILLR